MKKRLMITSLVLALVIAVTLSTATYAWFTSNQSVTAQNITLKAASSDGTALGIGWGTTYGTTLTTASYLTGANPICPNLLVNKIYGSTPSAGTDIDDIVWKTAKIAGNDGAADVFGVVDNAAATDKYLVTDGTNTVIYLKNLSTANDIASVTLMADIEENTENENGTTLIRIGVFRLDSTSNKYELLGVMGLTGQKITIGTPITGNAVTTVSTSTDVIPVSTGINVAPAGLGVSSPTNTIQLKILIWLDGTVLTDAMAEKDAKITLTFTAA